MRKTLGCNARKERKLQIIQWGFLIWLSSQFYNVDILVNGLSSRMIGKTGFVRKHLLRYSGNPATQVLAPTDILGLARKNERRQKGSKNYMKAWKHFVDAAIPAIRLDLSQNLPHPVSIDELDQLSFDLGVAADYGKMPSFADPGARSGYALDYFCRSRLLAGLFVDTENPTLPSFWIDEFEGRWKQQDDDLFVSAVAFLAGGLESSSETQQNPVRLTSLGGGPGFDFVAAALAVTFSSAGSTAGLPSLHATILDYEEGWKDLVVAMGDSTCKVLQQSDWSCNWGGKCDITKPLGHPDNAACRAVVTTTNIWTCQYCVAENAGELRASNFVFFRDLWNAMPYGSVVIFTETTPRLWPEFYQVVQEHCPFMQVAFPHQKGPQLVMRKCDPLLPNEQLALSAREEESLFHFKTITESHEDRLNSGRGRQPKKRVINSVLSAA